jgi:hypothetical protein
MCLKDDIFGAKDPTDRQRLRERAARIKELLREAEERSQENCHIGDAVVDLLKEEQYEIARQL